MVVGIRIDKTLYNEFKPAAVADFGSVCNAVETYMLAHINARRSVKEGGLTRGNTGEKDVSVVIENVNIHRNLRERRLLDPDRSDVVSASEARKMAHADRVGGFVDKVLAQLPHDTASLIPLYQALQDVGVPDDVRDEVKEQVVGLWSTRENGGERPRHGAEMDKSEYSDLLNGLCEEEAGKMSKGR